ncbi:hypothetical protein ACIQCV_15770 [Dietzia maris]|uniref:hypothetical protein n=1 Tax=Dietzia maris TaxID=37915 RepID=UPI00344BFE5A
MATAEPLHSTNLRELMRATVALARSGDHRARRVTIGPRSGIVTPHTDTAGNLDAADLAAQVWAIGHDEPSDTGTYADGYYTHQGVAHIVYAPET